MGFFSARKDREGSPCEPMGHIYFVFVDGIGFGRREEDNPFHLFGGEIFHHLARDTPYRSDWAHEQETKEGHPPPRYRHEEKNWGMTSIDPSSGVKGLPQSGSGQTSLFSGVDGPLILGRHIPNFPSFTLKKHLAVHSVIKDFTDHDLRASLLNSYSPFYLEKIVPRGRFISASTLTQLASGRDLLTFRELARGEGLYMDITGDFLRQARESGDPKFMSGDWTGIDRDALEDGWEPAERGAKLVEIGHNYDMVLFEYFLTDKVGHDQNLDQAKIILSIIEEFVENAIDHLGPDDLLLLSSDHGNLEDCSTNTHTHNAVPLIAAGQGFRQALDSIGNLADIPRYIRQLKGLPFEHLHEAHLTQYD